MSRKLYIRILSIVAAFAATIATPGVAAAEVPYDFEPGSVTLTQLGTGANVAGGHPDLKVGFAFQLDPAIGAQGRAVQATRTVSVLLPPGFVGNPNATITCPLEDVVANEVAATAGRCPAAAAVGQGVINFNYPLGTAPPIQNRRLFRVPSGPNEAAAFVSSIGGVAVRISATVKPSTDYRVLARSTALSQAAVVRSFEATFWGVPANMQGPGPQCDGYIINNNKICLDNKPLTNPDLVDPKLRWGAPLTGLTKLALLTNPSVCGADLEAGLEAIPYGTVYSPATAVMSAGEITECGDQPFDVGLDVGPVSQASGEPTGYVVGIDVDQDMNPDNPATAHVRDVEVTLPEGISISPPSANGLDACTDAQLDLNGDSAPACPDASKLGTMTVSSPALEEPLTGDAFLGSQLSNDPASGEMYRLFLAMKGPGVLVKLKGAVKVDPETGQVTTTFKDNPQLPFDRMELRLFDGPRASLANPECGTHTASARFTSWAGQTREVSTSFDITEGCEKPAFDPKFRAGTSDPSAGASSEFSLTLARDPRMGEFKSIQKIQLPEGLLGAVGSVPLCQEAAAATGSCPESSRIGKVQLAAGAGSTPLWISQPGKEPTGVYLTGPYKGAPFGLAIKVPAQAGPFDLGRVVVRSALHVDERTAQITTGIDETRLIDPDGTVTQVLAAELPRVLKGVVINQREIRVIMDREDFLVNPTDCSQQQITAEVTSFDGDKVGVANRFRAVDCASLGFAPRFSAKILDKGRKSTLRSFHPRTQFTVAPRKGDANIAGARVVLPSSTILDQANIGTTCTRAQMAERKCPEASIVGYAKAWSPLLRKPVEGPVYLAANGGARPLPDLAAVLDGEIRVVLQGEIATQRGGGKARLQNTFRVVPDAPVERFVLTMQGGKKSGLLVNSTDLCRTKERGSAVFFGQNGRSHRLSPRIATTFNGCGKVRRQAARRKAARKAAARKAAARRAARA